MEQQIDIQLNDIKIKAMEACVKAPRAWAIRTIRDKTQRQTWFKPWDES
jgi:hypothetical protein